jgi:hypothetical protein
MKNLRAPISLCIFLIVAGCNNGGTVKKETAASNSGRHKSVVDSLYEQVLAGHDAAMAKYGKLKNAENRVEQLLDSMNKLPAKARVSLSTYVHQMDSLLAGIRRAKANMDKWMDDFNTDSALNNIQQRIHYLSAENAKVVEIRESIFTNLKKADSLLMKKL